MLKKVSFIMIGAFIALQFFAPLQLSHAKEEKDVSSKDPKEVVSEQLWNAGWSDDDS